MPSSKLHLSLVCIALAVWLGRLPATAQSHQDTISTYLNKGLKPTAADKAVYRRMAYYAKGQWMVREYFMSGLLHMTGSFEDDSLKVNTGAFMYYYENGKRSHAGNYVKGYKRGRWLSWSKTSGSIDRESDFNDSGRLEGLMRSWYANGTPYEEAYYKDGKLNGHGRWYHPNGQLSEEGEYENDLPVHTSFYTPTGKPDENGVPGVVMPTFHAEGYSKAESYIGAMVRYPKRAQRRGIEGRPVILFRIDATGSVQDTEVQDPVDPELDAEALRVVRGMPRWTPGRFHNMPCDSYYSLPIAFVLQ